MKEIWKPVLNYEGYYEVSNLGRVKSIERYRDNHGTLQLVPEKIKAVHDNGKGYLTCSLWKDGKEKIKYIHVLVAEAFILNPDNKPCVNHKDYNRKNNCVDNLEWVTYQENNIYSIPRRIVKPGPKGITIVKCDLDGYELEEYSAIREAERANGIANGRINAYFKYNYRQCGGYKWKIK